MTATAASPRSPCGSSPRATAASSPCSNCEDELLAVAGAVEIASLPGGVARRSMAGPYDLSLVEGSITTPRRRRADPRGPAASPVLVTIGACATAGGIQALRNFADVDEFTSLRLRPPGVHRARCATSTADRRPRAGRLRAARLPDRPAAAARGDLARSCRPQAARSAGTASASSASARGNVCVMVAHGTPCLGPVTQAGCGALCPSFNRGCYGCFGPMETPNTAALVRRAGGSSASTDRDLVRVFRDVQRRRGAVPRRSREAHDHTVAATTHGQHGRSRRWPGSRARAALEVVVRDGAGRRGAAGHLRAAAVLRGAAARPALHRAARHHRADLRHLPGRLPDERVPGDRGRLRRDGAPSQIRALRRLLYCGEWIESHALHVYLLHAPDFLGYESGIDLAARPSATSCERGLRLKKAGNQLMEVIGGRSIHPVNVRVGGFYRAPAAASCARWSPSSSGPGTPRSTPSRWVAGVRLPRLRPRLRVRLAAPPGPSTRSPRAGIVVEPRPRHPGRRLRRSTSPRCRCRTRPRCTRVLDGSGTYLTGPMARYSLNSDRLPDGARPGRRAPPGSAPRCTNPFRSIVVRAVETAVRCDEALRLIERLRAAGPAVRRRAAARGDRVRLHRGTARAALPPLPHRRATAHRRREDRPADLAEPAGHRGGPARVRPDRGSACRTTS